MIGLPRSTYYRRPAASATARAELDAPLRDQIAAIRAEFPAYGYRRVTQEMRRRGHVINHKRVQRVMQGMLAPPMPRRRPWVIAEPDTVTGAWYPNLAAALTPTGPDQLWVADLTYLRVASEFLYLAVLLDAWSRKVVGYAFGPILDARLPLAALDAALDSRDPPPGCVHHSDRGTQPRFNWSSQYSLCSPIAGNHPTPRPVFSIPESYAGEC
jgi:putative transposase